MPALTDQAPFATPSIPRDHFHQVPNSTSSTPNTPFPNSIPTSPTNFTHTFHPMTHKKKSHLHKLRNKRPNSHNANDSRCFRFIFPFFCEPHRRIEVHLLSLVSLSGLAASRGCVHSWRLPHRAARCGPPLRRFPCRPRRGGRTTMEVEWVRGTPPAEMSSLGRGNGGSDMLGTTWVTECPVCAGLIEMWSWPVRKQQGKM